MHLHGRPLSRARREEVANRVSSHETRQWSGTGGFKRVMRRKANAGPGRGCAAQQWRVCEPRLAAWRCPRFDSKLCQMRYGSTARSGSIAEDKQRDWHAIHNRAETIRAGAESVLER